MIATLTIDNDLQLHDKNSGLDNGYSIDAPVEGLEMPPIRQTAYAKIGEDGTVVASEFYDGRVVTIPGDVYARTQTEFRTARQDLAYACRVMKDDNGFPEPHLYTFTVLTGEEYYFYGFPKLVMNIGTNNHARFLLTIVTTDPFIYRTGQQSSGLFSVEVQGGAIYPVIYPVIYGAGSGGGGSVNNIGNAPAFPIITITGIVTQPRITNESTGEYVELDVTTTSAVDVIEINMLEKTITLNGTSILGDRINDSSWWSLEPGVNAINFETDDSDDTGTVELVWNTSYLGI